MIAMTLLQIVMVSPGNVKIFTYLLFGMLCKAPRAGPDRCYQILIIIIIYYLLQIACYHYLSI